MATHQPHICHVVPPYLLSAIADNSNNENQIRESARHTLTLHANYIGKREKRFAALTKPRGSRTSAPANAHGRQGIVPDHILQHIADCEDVDDDTRACAKRDLEHVKNIHAKYQQQQAREETSDQKAAVAAKQPSDTTEKTYRAVYDAKHDSDEANLPGKVIRVEGQKASKDESANEAYDNAGHVLSFYYDIFNWKSIDNNNMHVISSVHFGRNYENAFWDPEAAQMVYGDGHNFLTNFTGAVDVIGHELTHAVTEHTSPLDYSGQSGALNEHVSDVFGIMIKQRVENETADKADWLIGEYCLMPGVKGVALRSMKAPGTAYNDPRFGKDPQPANFKDYKATSDDNGGVHLYSGIPNKAFYNASIAFGGYSWEKAGKTWWETLRSGQIAPRCTFIQFADVTVAKAEELFGEEAASTVRKAWDDVGVTRRSYTRTGKD
ncbi:Metalloprotease [Hypoxylon trugodes]|uniref:Metalloprotease n=1 Tax=Hypoxylon trugodes TaxID=326681 RepID=UPI0021931A67|nr:Metalloprotease [Hypoxylon trugodes]KAI1387193.1 Metalloprotease [Hypoxylon trugodes]